MKIQTPTYQNYYQKIDQYIKAKGYKNKSNMYQYQIRDFLIWLENKGITQAKYISSQVVITYFEYLSTRPNKRLGGTLSASTISGHFFSISILLDNLIEWKEIKSTIVLPKFNRSSSKNPREILTQEEVHTLFSHCQTKIERAILSIAYGCGLRRSELEQLNLSEVQLSRGMLIVKNGKNNKRREVPMSDAIVKDLKQYVIQERPHYLHNNSVLEKAFFVNNQGKRMTGDLINTKLKAIIERTNDYTIIQKNITLHCLRHSIATHLLERNAGIDFVRDFLGHANIDTSHLYAIRRKRQHNKIISHKLTK